MFVLFFLLIIIIEYNDIYNRCLVDIFVLYVNDFWVILFDNCDLIKSDG